VDSHLRGNDERKSGDDRGKGREHTKKFWQTNKLYFLFPLIIWLWANLHGSFVYGLLIGGLFLVQLILTNRSLAKKFTLSYLAALILTLVNPYGLTLWHEIIVNSQISAAEKINEWLPIYYAPINYAFLTFLVAIIFLLIINYRKITKLPLYYLVLCLIFLPLTVFSRRNIIVAVPLYLPVFLLLWRNDAVLRPLKANIFWKIVALVAVLVLMAKYIPQDFIGRVKQIDPFKVEFSNYPGLEIIDKLKQLPAGSRVFASYDWGGYLDYQAPDNLYFIDGRNSSYWRLNGRAALEDYQNLVQSPDKFMKMVDSYRINAVLLGDYNSHSGMGLQNADNKKRLELWLKLAQRLESGNWQQLTKGDATLPMLFERK
jgi:hypothetical protein